MCAVEFPFTEAGFYRIAALNSFFEKLPSVLKKDPRSMFYWEVAKNILRGYFSRNANGRLLPKILTSNCLEHEWKPLNVWLGSCREMSNLIKVMLMPNN